MGSTVSYLLMLQKYINSNKNLWNKRLYTVLGNVSKDFTTNNMNKQN